MVCMNCRRPTSTFRSILARHHSSISRGADLYPHGRPDFFAYHRWFLGLSHLVSLPIAGRFCRYHDPLLWLSPTPSTAIADHFFAYNRARSTRCPAHVHQARKRGDPEGPPRSHADAAGWFDGSRHHPRQGIPASAGVGGACGGGARVVAIGMRRGRGRAQRRRFPLAAGPTHP